MRIILKYTILPVGSRISISVFLGMHVQKLFFPHIRRAHYGESTLAYQS